LHYWRMCGAVTPSIPTEGSGRHVQWSERDVARLQAIGEFIEALAPFTDKVSTWGIGQIWRALEFSDEVELGSPPVRIHLTLRSPS